MSESEAYMGHMENLTQSVTRLEAIEQDVDQITPLVRSGLESLKVCAERLAKVREECAELKSLL
ncbi:exodeoxyribonuclease VII small subunit (plasmid) [Pseudomonas silesiensis]|uniref:exodeoxyribonuclease VII small subunit n=1 Tax=Pseudomonas silesiensis TaxID=1853130 RepID=UPI0030D5FC50